MSNKTDFRIIIIDDNPSIHQDFIKILKTESLSEIDILESKLFNKQHSSEQAVLPYFEIDVAYQGQEGVQRVKEAAQEGRPYSLAFVDIRMPPGLTGIETIKYIWEIDKNIQIVVCTAYSDYSWEETVSHLGKTDNLLILKKPFDSVSVRQLACALTKKWQLAEDSRKYTSMLKQQVADRTLSLQQSLSLVQSTFESSSDGILVVNNKGEIIDYNQKFSDMLEIPASILNTKSEKQVLEHIANQMEDAAEFLNKIEEFQANPDDISIDVVKFKNGKVFECYSQPHKLENKIVGRILDFRDITSRATLESELIYQATHDSLTGLDNRVQLINQMNIAIKTSEHNHSSFAVLFIDLDRFKLINDSLSHAVGDELLKAAAIRLQKSIRSEDVLARIGGDEFVIILMNAGGAKNIEPKIKKLVSAFQIPFAIENRKMTLTASIGVSLYPQHGDTADILIRNADVAMYRVKSQKGNNFKFYASEMNLQSLAMLDQETELRQAIAEGEFFLCYQPQIDLKDKKLVAVEALIRWQHPQKGVLLPKDFIPLAEETGLIVPIGEWVLRTACAQNKAWQDAGFPSIRMAVNVTIEQFKKQNLVELVGSVLRETGLKAEYLELELTENVVLSNKEIIKIITEIKQLGVSIAIDDFGTGYSSLSYLHKIPLDRLKIDGSFIQHIKSSTDDEVIIRALIAVAKNLNLDVLAEGVETTEQVDFLRKNDCGDVQGYYFSTPLTKNEIEDYFENFSNSGKSTVWKDK